VQNLVARPAEQVLGQIAGIEHTYSVSRPGVAMITVQFQVGVPRTEALVRLYDVINANQDWLPRRPGHADTDRQAQGHRRRAGAGRHAVGP
jgi:multidrug efflux pump subunit AcrB